MACRIPIIWKRRQHRRGDRARGRRRAGDHRHPGRQVEGRPVTGRTCSASRNPRTWRRPASATCPCWWPPRGNGATTVASTMRIAAMAGHPGVRHRRHRRRAPAAREELRHLGRSRGDGGEQCRRGLRRGQIDPRYGPDARISGNGGRAGDHGRPTSSRAFYSRDSGHKSPFTADTRRRDRRHRRGRNGSIGPERRAGHRQPDPASEDEIPAAEIDRQIQGALIEADTTGYRGKTLTPFLLKRVAALTEGRSLVANIALVRNNAHLGAAIAVALAG